MNKDGSGHELQLKSIYQVKWMEFAEVLNDNSLILGFRATQSVNLRSEIDKYGKTITTILVDSNGDTLKTYNANSKQPEKIQQEKKT
jgi:hypothetical protein